jgi:hypothetical protein
MASFPNQSIAASSICAPGDDPGECTERALFTLSKPIKVIVDGIEAETCELRMRALAISDLPFLDQFSAKPGTLLVNLVALLSDLSVAEVQTITVSDFIPPAMDAIWQVEHLCIRMGLPHRIFTHPHDADDQGEDNA